MLDLKVLRALCLRLPGAFEVFPFGPETAVMKVAGTASAGGKVEAKMFALFWGNRAPLRINVKCDPVLAEQLRFAHPEITPGYHMNKKHWNTVDCSGALPAATVGDLIEDSYDLVVASLPRPQRESLGWTGLVERG